MSRRHRVAAVVAAAGLNARCETELAPIVLDISKNCNEVEIIVLADNLGQLSDGTRDQIIDVAADTANSAAAWVLVVAAGTSELTLRHLAGGEVLSEVPLDLPATFKSATRLRTSPDRDEVYITVQTPGAFQVWRAIERDAVTFVQRSENFVAFPRDSVTCSPCDTTDWYRDLLFLEGAPYLVSVPPFSPNVAISVWVGRIETVGDGANDLSNLVLKAEHRLNFEPRCDPEDAEEDAEGCEAANALVSHPSVSVLGLQSDPRPPTAALFASRERVEEADLAGLVSTFDVFVVLVGLDNDGIPAGILRSEQSDFLATQPPGPPSGVVVDPFATYTLATMPGEGPRLLRLPRISFEEGFDELPVADLEGQRLMQLDGDIALGRLTNGVWNVTKLFPDSVTESRPTRYESAAPIVDVDDAGPGMFLLRRSAAAPQLVRLACASAATDAQP